MSKLKRYSPELKNKIKAEYITGIGRKDLAEKYKIPENTICAWIDKENWSKARKQNTNKSQTKIIEKTSEKQAKAAVDELEFADFGLSIVAKTLKRIDKKLESGEELTATEYAMLSRTITDGTKSISEMLKTKGLYTGKTEEKHKHSGDINHKVIPIFGNVSLNLPHQLNPDSSS